MNFVLSPLDMGIIIISLVAVVAVGLWAARNQEPTARGYFLASGKLPWYIIGAAFVSTSVSSEQIVGTIGQAYQHGLGVANWEWFGLPCMSVLIVIFIPLYLRARITTVSEYLGRRFGSLCSDIYSWIMLPAYVVIFLVPVLYGGSLAFASVTGWNFYVVLWGGVALVAVYTIKGGLASVMWTDAVQCLFLMGGGVLLFWVALGHVPGGWAAMAAAQPERFHLYHPANDPLAPFAGIIAGVFSVFTFYQAGNQVMIQRVLGARSIWDGLVGIVWSGFINLFRPLVTCLLGLIVFHWVSVLHAAPPLANPDQAFPFALKVFAPDWGLRGIVLAGFLAAVMSTVSALANSTATLFSLDVYHKLIRPRATDRELVFAGKAAAFAALVVAALLAPAVEHFGGIFRYFQTGVTLLATPFITVIWLGVFWPRANYASALFGLVGGLLITVTTALGVPAFLNTFAFAELPGWLRAVTSTTVDATGHTQIGVHWLYLALLAQVQIIIGMVVVALVTRRPDSELIRPLLWRPALLKQFARDRPRPWYQNVWLYFALYAVLWFAVYWRFW